QHPEWPSHILGACVALTPLFVARHDRIVDLVCSSLFRELPKHWSLLNDEPVHTTAHVAHHKPGIVVFCPARIFVIEVGVTADSDIDKVLNFKLARYLPLARALEMTHGKKVTTIPVIMGHLGCMDRASQALREILPKSHRSVSRCIQKFVLKAAAKILFAVTASNATTNIENAAMLSSRPSRRVVRSDPNSLESADPLRDEELFEDNSRFLPPPELSHNSRKKINVFVASPPRATEKEETDDSSSISSSSSSEASPVQPPAQVESTSAALALLSIGEEKTVPEISPVIPRRALNICVSTRIPVQTAADSSAPKKRRRGRRGMKRHKAAERDDKGKNSGVKTGHTGAARPKGSQRPNTGSKTKSAAKRHRTARPRPAKARGPSQQPFIQAPAPCAHSAHPGYPPLPGYCCCHRPVAPCQAPLVCHNQSAAQNPWDLLT
ncbi:hypothetical protein HZS_1107, partial [Henneguya salminicola]